MLPRLKHSNKRHVQLNSNCAAAWRCVMKSDYTCAGSGLNYLGMSHMSQLSASLQQITQTIH